MINVNKLFRRLSIVTLDPGVTLLALRGLRRRDGYYPFLDAWQRRRETPATAEVGGSVWKTLLRALVTTSGR